MINMICNNNINNNYNYKNIKDYDDDKPFKPY